MHTQSLRDTINETRMLIHTQKHTQAHIPHGVGNMSEQSIIWHLNQSLLLEVGRMLQGRFIQMTNNLETLCLSPDCLESKRELHIPTALISSRWALQLFSPVFLHCFPCFYPRRSAIGKGIPKSKAHLLWLWVRCCAVGDKATGKLFNCKMEHNWW